VDWNVLDDEVKSRAPGMSAKQYMEKAYYFQMSLPLAVRYHYCRTNRNVAPH
jgi:hypothetical protein